MSAIKVLQRPRQSILGIGYELILRGADTGGQYELMRFIAPPQVGPPPHVHKHEDECFHILSGQFRVLLGEDWYDTRPGDTVHLPRGVPHAFQNTSNTISELLCWVTPATLEDFFAALVSDWPETQEFPTPPQGTDIQSMLAAAQQHEIEMLMGES
ncbi:MAG: cupin domain-containing protein [Planctomycetota bacterium]|nr:MAG: cupin domain-containing protein [Planctomycetota bacterium]REJ92536.1 MAG: cupin domain-containing protein [Planctomycetota bacterium]REK24110.1 MAG: cupin domain-containing protein [Planctomycetota bacterium]REK38312.1 MAG: cupin domain-containing protein [Planctomycetota bacterium]